MLLLMALPFSSQAATRLELLCSGAKCGTQPIGRSNGRILLPDWLHTAKSASMKQPRGPMCSRPKITPKSGEVERLRDCEEVVGKLSFFARHTGVGTENKELMSSLETVEGKKCERCNRTAYDIYCFFTQAPKRSR